VNFEIAAAASRDASRGSRRLLDRRGEPPRSRPVLFEF
jgi:hypothetical protein